MELSGFVVEFLLWVITAVVPILTGIAIQRLKRYRIAEEIKTKEKLVMKGVEFAEQAYYDYDGPEQYLKAREWVVQRFKQYGFKINESELEGLIDAAVYEMKEKWLEFNE